MPLKAKKTSSLTVNEDRVIDKLVELAKKYKKLYDEMEAELISINPNSNSITIFLHTKAFLKYFNEKIKYGDYQLVRTTRHKTLPYRMTVKYKDIVFVALLSEDSFRRYCIESEVLD